MKQLVIKLNPELTAQYLEIVSNKTKAEMENNMEASGAYIKIGIGVLPGVTFLEELTVDGKKLKISEPDYDAVTVEIE